jgi:hypothetical protein
MPSGVEVGSIAAPPEEMDRWVVIERAVDGTPYVVAEACVEEGGACDLLASFSRHALVTTRQAALNDTELRSAVDRWDIGDDALATCVETLIGRELDALQIEIMSEERRALEAQGWDAEAAALAVALKYEGSEAAAELAHFIDKRRRRKRLG